MSVVTLDHGGDERLLAREILIERADADAGDFGNPVGARLLKTFANQNASGCLDQRVDGGAGSLLQGIFPGVCRRLARHGLVVRMRVGKASECSHYRRGRSPMDRSKLVPAGRSR
jgi:hypothetical protein